MITRRSLLLITTMWCAAIGNCGTQDPARAEPESRITLVIDYGDGVQKHFTSLAWKKGLTVQDALRLAEHHPRGIRCVFSGKGATALLTRIDDVTNQGSGKNWVYRVNGKLGEVSCGIRQLNASDAVLWRFEEYQ